MWSVNVSSDMLLVIRIVITFWMLHGIVMKRSMTASKLRVLLNDHVSI